MANGIFAKLAFSDAKAPNFCLAMGSDSRNMYLTMYATLAASLKRRDHSSGERSPMYDSSSVFIARSHSSMPAT